MCSDWQVIEEDVSEVLSKFPEGYFDAVFCDPPYGISFMGEKWDHGVPDKEVWSEVMRVMKPGAHLMAFGGSRTFHRLTCAIEDAGLEIRDCIMWLHGEGMPKGASVGKVIAKKAESEEDRQASVLFNGYKTTLKPAYEPIVLAMKPVDKTFSSNALKYGVAGLNVDECMVPVDKGDDIYAKNPHTKGGFGHSNATLYGSSKGAPVYDPSKGRFPADVIHDGSSDVLSCFETSDEDNNSASRFFYCAKASAKERNAGIAKNEKRNTHKCVKPLALTEYLSRLVLPPQMGHCRKILVPFSGSGSEMIGAMLAGWEEVVGVEIDSEYVEISKKRIAHWLAEKE